MGGKKKIDKFVHSKLTGWLCGTDGLVQSEVVFAVGGGETRGTSHKAASNHLTRLEELWLTANRYA